MNSLINTGFLYGLPTVDETITVACSGTEATQTFRRPGLWLIQNIGPHVAYLRMLPIGSSYTASPTVDMPLFPVGSGDNSSVIVMISATRQNQQSGHNELHAICSPGDTSTLKCTLISKLSMP